MIIKHNIVQGEMDGIACCIAFPLPNNDEFKGKIAVIVAPV
jgi:hypothetical protein